MASIFTKIVKGEIPSFKIAEDDDNFAFLDINPVAKGHVLVIPKKETDYIFDMESEEYLSLMKFAHKIAPAIKKAVPCNRIGIAVVGLEVPHAHIHLIPINSVSDMSFSNKMNLSKDELQQIAEKITSHL